MYDEYRSLPEKGRSKKARRRHRRAMAERKDQLRRRERLSRRHEERERREVVEARLAEDRSFDPKSVVRRILDRLGRDLRYKRRIKALVEILVERAPQLLIEENVCVLARIVGLCWIRPLQDWKPRGRGRFSRLRSLSEHLNQRYPVPAFVKRAFFDPETYDSKACRVVPLYGHLARGDSLRHCVEIGVVGLPLTRRMSHLFLRSPPGTSLPRAVLRAMVLGFGGDDRLAAALDTEHFWGMRGSTAFKSSLIHWFCRQPDLDPARVGPLVDYVESRYAENTAFEMKGRTYGSLKRGMEIWHRDLKLERRLYGVRFTPSGYAAGSWLMKTRVSGRCEGREVWTMDEILSSRDLVREGRKMGHCVASYAGGIDDGTRSIWSLRCNGSRRLTVEVSHSLRKVVQARGKYNRLGKGRETAMVRKWARENTLGVGDLTAGW